MPAPSRLLAGTPDPTTTSGEASSEGAGGDGDSKVSGFRVCGFWKFVPFSLGIFGVTDPRAAPCNAGFGNPSGRGGPW